MTLPFPTTPAQAARINGIVGEMVRAGVPLAHKAGRLAVLDGGIFDLLATWANATSERERRDIMADIEASILDYGRAGE